MMTSLSVSLNRRSTSEMSVGKAQAGVRGSAMIDVAPSAFQASTCLRPPVGLLAARAGRAPSSGSAAGIAARRRARTGVRGRRAPRPWLVGCEVRAPAVGEPARSGAAPRRAAPAARGCPRRTRWESAAGWACGLSPAWLIRWNSPRKSTTGSVHSARSTAICSALRRPRFVEGLVERLELHRVPADADAQAQRGRRSARRSAAACLATSAVCRCGRIRMPVASVIRRGDARRGTPISVSASVHDRLVRVRRQRRMRVERRIGPQDVVGHEEMVGAHGLDGPDELADGRDVGAALRLREDRRRASSPCPRAATPRR